MSQLDPRQGATTDQLRDDIQSGRTGDKVPGFDPAAAPLGTDDEAAGAPPSPQTVQAARIQEQAGPADGGRPNASTPEMQPDGRPPATDKGMLLGALAGLGAAAALAVALVAAL